MRFFRVLVCLQAGAAFGAVQLPLVFESHGRAFTARSAGYSVILDARGPVLRFADTGRTLQVAAAGAARRAPEGLDALPARASRFLGNDRRQWGTAPIFRRVAYRNVYPGIDAVYYGNDRQLEYDFVLQPGADPRRIRVEFRGADRVGINAAGDVVVETAGAQLIQRKPRVYDGAGAAVAASYRLAGRNAVAFDIGPFDRSKTLTIDPVLVYSSMLGASGTDLIRAVKIDQAGMIYVAGSIVNSDITASDGAFQDLNGGDRDVFVAKINPAVQGPGSLLMFTYIGGGGADFPTGMAIDREGNIYVAGSTASTNFPIAGAAAKTASGGGATDAFAFKLNPGFDALLYSTYLGGNDTDIANAVDVDAAGNIYIVGTTRSGDFPLTGSAYQGARWGTQDAFLAKLNPSATDSLAYSTFLGGEVSDEGIAVSVAPDQTVAIAGTTFSKIFPQAGQSLQPEFAGGIDVFVSRFDTTKPGEPGLIYSSYFGGAGLDVVRKIAFEPAGRLLLTGYTMSDNLPGVASGLRNVRAGSSDAFVAAMRFSGATAAVEYASYLGGSDGEAAYDIAPGPQGTAVVTGYTLSRDFPVSPDATQPAYGGGVDVFVAQIDLASGPSGLVYATYAGQNGTHVGYSVAVTANGTVVVAGSTSAQHLRVTGNANQPDFAGGLTDGFLFVLAPGEGTPQPLSYFGDRLRNP